MKITEVKLALNRKTDFLPMVDVYGVTESVHESARHHVAHYNLRNERVARDLANKIADENGIEVTKAG